MAQEIRGILTPFQRDRKRDFANGVDWDLVLSKVRQVLGTRGDTPTSVGELPWRTEFGSGIHLLRHSNNDSVLAEIARVRVRDALRAWAPNVAVASIGVVRKDSELTLRIAVAERTSGAERSTEVRL